jgi:hypothetical protein
MLKLHHMNLLNEIQETTLMMNLYQQQQLQQQQQQLQQQQASAKGSVGGNDQMAMLLQQQGGSSGGMDSLYGNGGGLAQRGSLGLGVVPPQSSDQQMQMLRQQQTMMQAAAASTGAGSTQPDILKSQQEQASLEGKLQKLKDDIAQRQKEAEELEKVANVQASGTKGSSEGRKRPPENANKAAPKRAKAEIN